MPGSPFFEPMKKGVLVELMGVWWPQRRELVARGLVGLRGEKGEVRTLGNWERDCSLCRGPNLIF